MTLIISEMLIFIYLKLLEVLILEQKIMTQSKMLKKNSLDFYASVKSLYLQDRQQKILNSKKIVNTQNDSDWEEIESQ